MEENLSLNIGTCERQDAMNKLLTITAEVDSQRTHRHEMDEKRFQLDEEKDSRLLRNDGLEEAGWEEGRLRRCFTWKCLQRGQPSRNLTDFFKMIIHLKMDRRIHETQSHVVMELIL